MSSLRLADPRNPADSVTAPSYRTADSLPSPAEPPAPLLGRGRKRRAIIWGIVSTVLSAIGLLGMCLFEQYNGMLSELRADLKHFNETSGEFVKKDRVQHFRDTMKDCLKELTASNAARSVLEAKLRASEKVNEDVMRELQQVRERLAYLEGLRAARPNGPGRPGAPESAPQKSAASRVTSGSPSRPDL